MARSLLFVSDDATASPGGRGAAEEDAMSCDSKVLVLRKTRKRGQVHSKNQGCPFTRSRSVWCYGLCRPVEGRGPCGRYAHHVLRGRTQRAIAAQLDRDECWDDFDPTELEHPELWRKTGAW